MQEKYYTHFLLNEPGSHGLSEYKGVVELYRVSGSDLSDEDIRRILAENFELDAEEVTLIQWSRLH